MAQQGIWVISLNKDARQDTTERFPCSVSYVSRLGEIKLSVVIVLANVKQRREIGRSGLSEIKVAQSDVLLLFNKKC